MHLFEFDQNDEVNAILIAAKQLEQKQKNGELKKNWTVDQLLKFLNDRLSAMPGNDIALKKSDLIDMISSQENPFKKSIDNIKGQEVVFKGNQSPEPPEAPPPEKSKQVVDKMAQHAMK